VLRDLLAQFNDVAMQVNQISRRCSRPRSSATAAAQLNGNAEELQRLVRQFKL